MNLVFNRYFERSFEDIFKNLANIVMTCKGAKMATILDL